MAFGTNNGTKYVGNEGIIKLIESIGTPVAISHVRDYVMTEVAADVDLSEQGATWSDGTVGQKTFKVTANIWRGKGTAKPLLRTGLYDCSFLYDDQSTDGVITGTFRLLSVGTEMKLNQGVLYSGCEFVSCGTVTITDPA